MNAPAAIDPDFRAPAAWERYIPSVEAFRPGCSDMEKRQRAGIMLLRDMAAAAQRRAGWEASVALHAIETIAGRHALSSLSLAELDATRRALIRLYTGARDLDHTFSHDGR